MRRAYFMLPLLLASGWVCAGGAPASFAASALPETVDRIVARIEGDIILLSEMRELAAYQQLVEGHAELEDELLRALIEQWVVRNEAQESQFPSPPAAEIDAESNRIQSSFPNPQAYRERLAALGMTPQSVRRMVQQQFYLARYLDYKFRPAVQIEDAAISKYYQDELTPALRARGQTPPPLDDLREQIREVLVQRGITERADGWFEETKSRLQIEIMPAPRADGRP
jgi:hypothetical protein